MFHTAENENKDRFPLRQFGLFKDQIIVRKDPYRLLYFTIKFIQ